MQSKRNKQQQHHHVLRAFFILRSLRANNPEKERSLRENSKTTCPRHHHPERNGCWRQTQSNVWSVARDAIRDVFSSCRPVDQEVTALQRRHHHLVSPATRALMNIPMFA